MEYPALDMMNKENSGVDHGNAPFKDLLPGEEIIRDNQPASEDERPKREASNLFYYVWGSENYIK